MRSIKAVFLKQVSETLKNKAVLIQFLLLPLLAVVMENSINVENMPEHFFVKLFSVMYVGMAPLTCMSSIISEEKEQNTLRVLIMSNVKPFAYLMGISLYVWLMCMGGAVIFALCGSFSGADLINFMLIMSAGIIISGLVGAVIGISCKNQMSAASISIPIMMIFSFLPMLSMFNEKIEKIARITYSQQMSNLINNLGNGASTENIAVISANFIVAVILFAAAFMKKEPE